MLPSARVQVCTGWERSSHQLACMSLAGPQCWGIPPGVVLRSSKGESDGAFWPEPRMGWGEDRGVPGPWLIRSQAPPLLRSCSRMVTHHH